MSQSGRSKAKRSSQRPQSRAEPQGSNGSANQQQDRSNSQAQDNTPYSAVTSSTSRPQRASGEERRQSNVTFAAADPLAPDDSISRVRTRSTWPGPNTNSDRKGTRESRTPWKTKGSQVSRTSSQNGTAWSGTGAALTEHNLERFNEANGKETNGEYSNQEARSDQQEAPQSTQRGSQRKQNGANNNGAQSRGDETAARRSSRGYSTTQNGYTQSRNINTQRATMGGTENRVSSQKPGAFAQEAVSNSPVKQQTVAASKNVIDADGAKSRGNGTNAGATNASQSKATTQNRSRKDSVMQEGAYAAQTSKEVHESYNIGANPASGSKAPTKPSSASRPHSSGSPSSPTSPTSPNIPRGWERKVRVITKRWADGKETTEREVTVQPVGAG